MITKWERKFFYVFSSRFFTALRVLKLVFSSLSFRNAVKEY